MGLLVNEIFLHEAVDIVDVDEEIRYLVAGADGVEVAKIVELELVYRVVLGDDFHDLAKI